MIATCKFCKGIVAPVAILKLSPKLLATIPAEQLAIMRFTAAVTEHVRDNHPEYLQHVQQLAGNFIGHCTLSTVDPAGEHANQFRAMCNMDNAQLRAYWEAMPNPPHPDVLAQLNDEARERLEEAQKLDAAGAGDPNTLPNAGLILT